MHAPDLKPIRDLLMVAIDFQQLSIRVSSVDGFRRPPDP
jgi:hypothetical protein